MEGCGAVYHVAADYRLYTRKPEEMYASNVDGTRNLLAAAVANWVIGRWFNDPAAARAGTPGNGLALQNIRQRLLTRYGSAAQKKQWLEPLLDGWDAEQVRVAKRFNRRAR